ncbi:MAG: HelD family protein [Dermatophilaceae bacterium]
MGVRLRRRFGVDRGRLTAYEDDRPAGADLADGAVAADGVAIDRDDAAGADGTDTAGTAGVHTAGLAATRHSAILAAEIERPRSGPMRDIVSTIQPEQDEIVRSDVGTSICVQGAPGTGKTAVGLHRAAWLLYAFRSRLERSGVLVVGPNRAFLDHIGAVLPSLGEVRVQHATVDSLLDRGRVRTEEPTEVATLKGDARLAAVLHRAVWSHVGTPDEALVVPRGARRWRVPAYEVRDELDALTTRGVRYSAARELLPQRLAHRVLLQLERAGHIPDDRVQDAIARSAPVRTYLRALWPALDPTAVLSDLFSDADALAAAAHGILTPDEQRMLLWRSPPRTKGAARWSTADLALLDEVADLLDRTPSLGHVVLDEAQDLSPMQLRAVGRRASTGSLTVLGDLAQGTTPWAAESWDHAMAHLGHPAHVRVVLDRGFRVPGLVIDFAARLLPEIAPGLGVPRAVRDDPGELTVIRPDDGELASAVVQAVHIAVVEPGTVGVICRDDTVSDLDAALTSAGLAHGRLGAGHGDDADHRVELVPASIAKGLEFDRVVVVEPAAIVAAEPDRRTGLRRLYVVLTRAVSALTVVHTAPLPDALADARPD